jgi:hypothetical protein
MYGSHVLDRQREQESDHGAKRDRAPAPPAPPQFGTLAWASAVGNQAVARLARQAAAEAPPAEEAAEEAPLAEEPDATAEEAGPTEEESPDTEDLPEALPE